MTPLNSTLRIIVAIMGLAFFFSALAIGEFLWGLGVLAFFGLAFTSLTFSGLDPSAKSPEARQWFIATIVIGALAGFLLLVIGAIQIADGNTKDGITLLGAFGWLLYVWRKQRHEIKGVISSQSGDK